MKPSEKFIQETIEVFSRYYGYTISREEAEEIIDSYLRLFEIIGKNSQQQEARTYESTNEYAEVSIADFIK